MTRKKNEQVPNQQNDSVLSVRNEPQQEMPQIDPNYQIPPITVRIYPVSNPKNMLRATANINLGKMFAVKGFQIFDSKKGLFVKPPATHYTKDGTWMDKDIFFPISSEARESLYNSILNSYHIVMNAREEQDDTFDLLEDDGDLPFTDAAPIPDESEDPGFKMTM